MSVQVEVRGYGVVQVPAGSSLLEACEAGAIPMESACGGFACCNSCRVVVHDGAAGLSPCLDEEQPFLDAPDQRLGCQARLETGAVVVSLAPGM